MTPQKILKNYFGYTSFREPQFEIITSIVQCRDTVAILPTGAGKSVCYQIPGILLGGITVVITPLISLMVDQVSNLKHKQLSAYYLVGSQKKEEQKNVWQQLQQSQQAFLYISPEKLTTKSVQTQLALLSTSLVVIDEAHCISTWGHDFRPSYRTIADSLHQVEIKAPIFACTATATKKVEDDMCRQLMLRNPVVFRSSVFRKNLKFLNTTCTSDLHKKIIITWLVKLHENQSGIIFVQTRKAALEVAIFLQRILPTEQIGYYHGGLESERRQQIQNDFIQNKIKILVATNAFGMGVDKPNIRFVIHYQLSGTMADYYQEAGRAGRDRAPSWCYLLLHKPDIAIHLDRIKTLKIRGQKERADHQLKELRFMSSYARANKNLSARICRYFGELKTLQEPMHSPQSNQIKNRLWRQTKKLSKELKNQHPNLAALMVATTTYDYNHLPGVGRGVVKKIKTEVI